MIEYIPFIAVVAMILIGLYTVLFRRNLIKIVIGISIIERVNLFNHLRYRDVNAPIFTSLPSEPVILRKWPGAQALTLTSIVIVSQSLQDAFLGHAYLPKIGTLDVNSEVEGMTFLDFPVTYVPGDSDSC
jgi:multicomponent Na+:H+ antiporter subunit C